MLLMDKGSFAMIVPALPPELGEFVEQQIAAGKYHSEEDLVRSFREFDFHYLRISGAVEGQW